MVARCMPIGLQDWRISDMIASNWIQRINVTLSTTVNSQFNEYEELGRQEMRQQVTAILYSWHLYCNQNYIHMINRDCSFSFIKFTKLPRKLPCFHRKYRFLPPSTNPPLHLTRPKCVRNAHGEHSQHFFVLLPAHGEAKGFLRDLQRVADGARWVTL